MLVIKFEFVIRIKSSENIKTEVNAQEVKVWKNETRGRVRGTVTFIEKWLEMKTEKERD